MTMTAQGSFAVVTAALEAATGPGRPAGGWVKFCCPVHEADGRHHRPSLGVKHLADVGRTKIRCYAGCPDEQILDTLGLRVRDLYDAPITRGSTTGRAAAAPRPRQVSRADRAIDAAGLPLSRPKPDLGQQISGWRQQAVYPYVRDNGEVAGEVIRREATFTGGRKKEFSQRRWDPDTGAWVREGFEPIPFRLPELLDAVAAGRTVYVVEGEKDVLTAAAYGITATTNAGGALSWTSAHAGWLTGAASVVIVADRDAPGYRRADRVRDSLEGLVDHVRVVQARTGKDLTDHLMAGHRLADLDPVPVLDPSPSLPLAPSDIHTQLSTDGGFLMGDFFRDDAVVYHDDTVDSGGQHFVRFMQQLLQQFLVIAQRIEAQRRQDAAEAKANGEQAEREYAARMAAEQKAVETRLVAMAKHGWGNASRSEIAAAARDAAAWSSDSAVAHKALSELASHVQQRFGVHVDTATGYVTVDAPELADQLAAAELERATAARVDTARDEMVALIGADADLTESAKAALYADIDTWRRNPDGHSLAGLTKKVQAAAGDKTATRVRFVAAYLATPNIEVPIEELGATSTLSATNELRKMAQPLVDPAEEVKPRIDALLVRYQDRLRYGVDTTTVTDQLKKAVSVLPAEEQQTVRAHAVKIRNAPTAEHKPLWPNHVDRQELDAVVRLYAAMAPQVEAMAVAEQPLNPAGQVDAVGAEQLKKQADRHRRTIEHAADAGEGLHPLEKTQLKSVLRVIEAGGGPEMVPELLFCDDRSAAAVDADRSEQIAHETSAHARRQLDQILDMGAVDPSTVRACRDEIASVLDAQTAVAAGRANVIDLQDRGADDKLVAKLAAVGVAENVRDRVRDHLDTATSSAMAAGQSARRIQARWSERTEQIAESRSGAVAYDSAERRAATEASMRAAGVSTDTIAGRMAADVSHAHPPKAGLNTPPARGGKARRTQPGQGIHRATHRRGRGDQRGYGK
ncbi:toprim domain-containing protein [Nocardia otitidiscaviarum]|uniref:toprim domain-containing protein n=1 Tax=Nocardia otitidiscaviarum TaxID=1823 RepID=UPI0020CDC776|nr:toprim domain-containing protein [Nocardia otitidiscaviarum]MCP9625251.1 toprim domain-containing protein [Nocardia otitidiscaviarum]